MDKEPEKDIVPQEDTSPEEPQLAQPLQTFDTDVEKYLKENKGSEKEVAKALKRSRKGEPQKNTGAPQEPKSFVLPSKEIHSPLNAIRAEAGTLLKQEEEATLPKVKAPPLPPPPPKSPNQVDSIETYQDTVEKYVKKENISEVTVAAAEAQRRALQPQAAEPGESHLTRNLVAVVAGLVLIVGASGAFAYAYIHSQPLPAVSNPSAPYIAIDSTKELTLDSGDTRALALSKIVAAKDQTRLSLGLIGLIKLTVASTSGIQPLSAQRFLGVIAPNLPSEFLRTIKPEFMLGVHSFDVNQPLLIFGVESYQGAFAGMLAWEKKMQSDLSPLFRYTPVTSASDVATSSTPQVVASPFVDMIIENHDARVLKDAAGSVVLLWTFLDRSTILVTTNPNTVHEVISRQKKAPQL